MRVAHIPVYRKADVTLPAELVSALPERIALFTTTQWMDRLDKVKAQLEEAGKTVSLYQPRHTSAPGQILGCSIQTWPDVDAFLYLGEGEFHPKALLFKNSQPVYRYDPLLEKWDLFGKEEVERIMRRHKGAMLKFLHADVVGVLSTTKNGQKDLQAIVKLREKYPQKDFVHFLCNTVDWEGLNDFPFIEVWVNTGCPRIGLDDQNKSDKPLLNAEHLLEGEHSF